ncbi:MAG TPA: isochorismate synthase, partial [Solirubrobacteraceae bacterium]
MALGTGSRAPFSLSESERELLHARLARAVRRARRTGRATLATLTLSLTPNVDPSAVVCASRREGEEWFLFEQPERGRAALACLGRAASLQASGQGRFAAVAERW